MFERYTEKARRAIFFARYEASQHGTRYIETPSLLLGILRENQGLVDRSFPAGVEDYARLVADVVALFPEGAEKIPTTVDLPLNQLAKRALTLAADEADRLHHKAIEPLHLLCGLLSAGGPETACLKSYGITLETLNPYLAASPRESAQREVAQRTLRALPEGRLDAAVTLLEGLASGKFEVTGTSTDGPFHFSFDDKKE
jgi:ATP-dependent Clp protease ATP-binding subunit ClpC